MFFIGIGNHIVHTQIEIERKKYTTDINFGKISYLPCSVDLY